MDVESSQAIAELRADMKRMGERLEAAIRDGLAENRRYFHVTTESLRGDIRLTAEGLIAIDAKVERLRRPCSQF